MYDKGYSVIKECQFKEPESGWFENESTTKRRAFLPSLMWSNFMPNSIGWRVYSWLSAKDGDARPSAGLWLFARNIYCTTKIYHWTSSFRSRVVSRQPVGFVERKMQHRNIIILHGRVLLSCGKMICFFGPFFFLRHRDKPILLGREARCW